MEGKEFGSKPQRDGGARGLQTVCGIDTPGFTVCIGGHPAVMERYQFPHLRDRRGSRHWDTINNGKFIYKISAEWTGTAGMKKEDITHLYIEIQLQLECANSPGTDRIGPANGIPWIRQHWGKMASANLNRNQDNTIDREPTIPLCLLNFIGLVSLQGCSHVGTLAVLSRTDESSQKMDQPCFSGW